MRYLAGVVLSCLVAATPWVAELIFSDPLHGGTLGSTHYVSSYADHVTPDQWNSWVKYTTPRLPATGTLAFWMNIAEPNEWQAAFLVTDARQSPSGITSPTFRLERGGVETGPYNLAFDHDAVGDWHQVYFGPPSLQRYRWYDVGVSWGPAGQSIWVNGECLAYSSYSKPNNTVAPDIPYWWGLGCTFNSWERYSEDPRHDWTFSAARTSFAHLRLYDTQEPNGATSAPVVPEPSSWWRWVPLQPLGCGAGHLGAAVRVRRGPPAPTLCGRPGRCPLAEALPR